LDVGCAVGGSCKELTRTFDDVVGIDYAQGFIDAANALKTNDLNYARSGEASLPGTSCSVEAFSPSEAAKLTFMKGDACNLPESLGTFDAVLAANLLCRLQEPLAFIDRLPSLVNKDGRVFFASPFSWMSEYTPPEKWLTPEQLAERMGENGFLLEEAAPEAVVIRDHARKFQFVVSHGMLFRRS
jgi:SAM-dependent methyltransferase